VRPAELLKRGISPEGVLDFSSSINPFGPPPGVWESLSRADIAAYPDPDALELRRELAGRLNVSPEELVVGAGAVELLRTVALAYFRPHAPVLIPEPTFGEYEVVSRLLGSPVVRVRFREEDGFAPDVERLAASLKRYRPYAVFLCNPNNPTGFYLEEEGFVRLLAAGRHTLFILDEAYISFVRDAWPSPRFLKECFLIIVRSLTKDYALAGVRLGYAIARREAAEVLRRVAPPWSVSAVAQAAGLAALREPGFLEASVAKVEEAREFLAAGLRRLGLRPLPSRTNFLLVKVGDGDRLRERLLSRGILVRSCRSFGLPEYVRVSVRPLSDCRRLISALEEVGLGPD